MNSGLLPLINYIAPQSPPSSVRRSLWRQLGRPLGGRGRTADLEAFSNITSPVFSEFVIVLEPSQSSYVSQDSLLFGKLGAINDVKPSNLVFLLEVSGRV